jgi:hypothetical protein
MDLPFGTIATYHHAVRIQVALSRFSHKVVEGKLVTYPPGIYGSVSMSAMPLKEPHPFIVGGLMGFPMNWV